MKTKNLFAVIIFTVLFIASFVFGSQKVKSDHYLTAADSTKHNYISADSTMMDQCKSMMKMCKMMMDNPEMMHGENGMMGGNMMNHNMSKTPAESSDSEEIQNDNTKTMNKSEHESHHKNK